MKEPIDDGTHIRTHMHEWKPIVFNRYLLFFFWKSFYRLISTVIVNCGTKEIAQSRCSPKNREKNWKKCVRACVCVCEQAWWKLIKCRRQKSIILSKYTDNCQTTTITTTTSATASQQQDRFVRSMLLMKFADGYGAHKRTHKHIPKNDLLVCTKREKRAAKKMKETSRSAIHSYSTIAHSG